MDIDVDDITDPLMVELDDHDVIFVRDVEFGCVSYLVRPWALDRVRILEVTEC